jgi:hypothetical protein
MCRLVLKFSAGFVQLLFLFHLFCHVAAYDDGVLRAIWSEVV